MKRYKEPPAIKRERARLAKLGTIPCYDASNGQGCFGRIDLKAFHEQHQYGKGEHPIRHECGRVLCRGDYCG